MPDHPPARLGFTHNGTGLLCLWLEPWGRDYWLSPGETVTIFGDDPAGWFHLQHQEGDVAIYCEGSVRDAWVEREGTRLACGHGRPTDAF